MRSAFQLRKVEHTRSGMQGVDHLQGNGILGAVQIRQKYNNMRYLGVDVEDAIKLAQGPDFWLNQRASFVRRFALASFGRSFMIIRLTSSRSHLEQRCRLALRC